MNIEMIQALEEIEKDKGIPKDMLLDAIKAALKSAYGKSGLGSKANAEIEIDEDEGEVHVYSTKEVVEEVEDEETEISLQEAEEEGYDCELGQELKIEVTPANFGRIAAQTARQVVIQRIREAERDILYQEFVTREGEILTGIIQRYHDDNVIIDLGRTEALLIPREQIQMKIMSLTKELRSILLKLNRRLKVLIF